MCVPVIDCSAAGSCRAEAAEPHLRGREYKGGTVLYCSGSFSLPAGCLVAVRLQGTQGGTEPKVHEDPCAPLAGFPFPLLFCTVVGPFGN